MNEGKFIRGACVCGDYVHKQGAEVKERAGKGGDLACALSEGGVQLWPSSLKG